MVGLVSAARPRVTVPGLGFGLGLEFGAAVVAAGPAGALAACGAPPEAVEAAQSSPPHLDPEVSPVLYAAGLSQLARLGP